MEGDWELSKENIQPRKEGRDINSLMVGLTPRKDGMTKMQDQMRQYELALRTGDSDDPMDIWFKYINWTEQHFPTGSGLEVKQLLERCIRQFNENVKYKNDERFVRLWLKYADMIRDPIEIFNYMNSEGIGTKFAGYYESWALALENAQNNKQADEVYQLGIARKAEPVGRLERRQSEFVKRIMAIVKDEVDGGPVDESATRGSLAPLSKKRNGKVSHDRVKAKSDKIKGGIKLKQPVKQVPGNTFAVFEDENAVTTRLPTGTGEWKKPPTNSTIVKENTQKPGKWNTGKLASAPSVRDVSRPQFEIHEDADAEQRPPETPKQVVMSDRKVLSTKKIDKRVEHADALEVITKKDDCKTEVKYCKGQVYCGNMEFSFEQLRAAAWFRKHGPIIDPRSDDNCTKRFTQDMEETAVIRTDIDANCNNDNVVDELANKDADFTVVNTDDMVRPRLPVIPMAEKPVSTKQRLDFSSTQCLSDNCKTFDDVPPKQSITDIQPRFDSAKVIAAATLNNKDVYPCHDQAANDPPIGKALNPTLNESGVDTLDDDIDDSIVGPTESTSVYDQAKFARDACQNPAAKRNVLQDWDMTRIESAAADNGDKINVDDTDRINHAPSTNLQERIIESDRPDKTVKVFAEEEEIKSNNEDDHLQTSPEHSGTSNPDAQEVEAVLASEKLAPGLSLSFAAPGLAFNPNEIFDDVPIKTEVESEGFVTVRRQSAKETYTKFETGVKPNTENNSELSRNWVPIADNVVKPKVCRPFVQAAQEEKLNKYNKVEPDVDMFDCGPNFSIFEDENGRAENAMSRENAKFSIFQDVGNSGPSNFKSLGAFAPIENPLKKPGAATSEVSNKNSVASLKPGNKEKDGLDENKENGESDKNKNAGQFSIFTDSFADSEMLSPGPKTNLPGKEMGPPIKPVVRKPLQSSKVLKPSAAEAKIQQQLANKDQSKGQQDSLKRQPFGQLTPAREDKQSRFNSPGFISCKPKSPLWQPSPTIHTKRAQQEVDAMYQQTLDLEKDFSLTQTQDSLNDFEQQFNMESNNPVAKSAFKVFEEDDMPFKKEPLLNENPQSLADKENLPQDFYASQTPGFETRNPHSKTVNHVFSTTYDKSYNSLFHRTVDDAFEQAASTPFSSSTACPCLSITGITRLLRESGLDPSQLPHESASYATQAPSESAFYPTQVAREPASFPAPVSQSLICEARNLSTIEETSENRSNSSSGSGSNTLNNYSRKSSSSSRGMSEGSDSECDRNSASAKRATRDTSSVFRLDYSDPRKQEAIPSQCRSRESVTEILESSSMKLPDVPSISNENSRVEMPMNPPSSQLSLNGRNTHGQSTTLNKEHVLLKEDSINEQSTLQTISPFERFENELPMNSSTSNGTINSSASSLNRPIDITGMKLLNKIVIVLPMQSYPHFFEMSDSIVDRFATNFKVTLGEKHFKIQRKIATGGFATVYAATEVDHPNSCETVLKVMQSPTLCCWEFYIGEQIHERLEDMELPQSFHEMFIKPRNGFVYSDGAVIQYPLHKGGTLLDLVNKLYMERVGYPELYALLYGADVCRIVKTMHDCSIIHGDVKPDNFLLKSIDGKIRNVRETNLLTLADYGRCLDLTMHSEDATFIGSCNTDKFECIEMKNNLPWKYQVDYYGVACTLHAILHGSYLETICKQGRYAPQKSPKKRQDKEFWMSVFDRLLNVADCNDHTVLDGIIRDFEIRLADPTKRSWFDGALKIQVAMS